MWRVENGLDTAALNKPKTKNEPSEMDGFFMQDIL